MSLPFLLPALGLVTGIFFAPFLSLSPQILLAAASLLFYPLWKSRGSRTYSVLFVCAAALAAASAWSQNARMPACGLQAWAGKTVNLEGEAAAPVRAGERNDGRSRIDFMLETRAILEVSEDGRHRFPVRGRVQVFVYGADEAPRAGDRVMVRGELVSPGPAANPRGFDYGRFLRRKKAQAFLRSYGTGAFQILEAAPVSRPAGALRQAMETFRTGIRHKIDFLWTGDSRALFKALILGEREEIPGRIREAFSRTGTAHLLSISGLHVALIAGSLFMLLLLAGLRQKAASLIGFYAVMAYVFIAGAGIPVRRAGLMLGGAFLAVLLDREKNTLNLLLLAAVLILAADPASLRDLSFQLSFCAVFFLLAAGEWKTAWLFRVSSGLMPTAVALLGTFPLILRTFYIFTPAAFPANLLAIPLFHLALLAALAALALPPWFFPATALARAAELSLKGGLAWIDGLAGLPGSFFYVRPPSDFQTGLYYAAVLGVLFLKKEAFRRWRKAAAVLLAMTAISFFIPWPRPDFEITFLSLGRQSAAHLQAGGRHWLFHGGTPGQTRFETVPHLKASGVRRLAGIVMAGEGSRAEKSLEVIEESFPVRVIEARSGETRLKSGVVLYASGGHWAAWIREAGHTLLLLSGANERVFGLVESRPSLRDADLLWFRFPPQGTASLMRFIRLVRPEVTILSSPDPEMEAAMRDEGAGYYSLELCGALQVRRGNGVPAMKSLRGGDSLPAGSCPFLPGPRAD